MKSGARVQMRLCPASHFRILTPNPQTMESLMRIATLALLGSLVFTTTSAAQDVQEHRGLWGGFGLGTGINGNEGNSWGFDAYGRLGGSLNQRVLLGVESAGWYGSRDITDLYRSNFSGVILFYPGARGGLYLKGGAGLAYINTSISELTTIGGIDYYNSVSEGKTGFGATAGVGFDIRLGRNIYLVPAVDWYLQAVGDTDATFGVPSTINIFAVTIGLVWH
jgi:hypothetical protein